MSVATQEKLLDNVLFDENTFCWFWKGGKNWFGYGLMTIKGKVKYVHRVSYEVFNGIIYNGLVIDHLCHNTSCCNPEHLEAVSRKENVIRGKGFAGKNKYKTHCPNGHELKEDNLYEPDIKRGRRRCNLCARKSDKLRTFRNTIKMVWCI